MSFGTTSANSVEPDIGCRSRVYFDNVMQKSLKPCQNNNKLTVAKKKFPHSTRCYINEVKVFSVLYLLC